MNFFIKGLNQKLIDHINKLDKFGFITDEWEWNEKRIQSLKIISQKLLEDLIKLHQKHQELGGSISQLIPSLRDLLADLNKMLEEQDKEKHREEMLLANKLIEHLRLSIEQQGYFDGRKNRGPIMYLTPKEIAYYRSLYEQSKFGPALKFLKKKWNERVDRPFIQGIKTIHWGKLESIKEAITNMNRTHEISCIGYLNPPFHCGWGGGVGLLLEGHVSLAGNSDLQTKQWTSFGKHKRYSEYAENLILNRETFTNNGGALVQGMNNYKFRDHNEFLVDNWAPRAIVIDPERFGDEEKQNQVTYIGKIKKIAEDNSLILVDINANQL